MQALQIPYQEEYVVPSRFGSAARLSGNLHTLQDRQAASPQPRWSPAMGPVKPLLRLQCFAELDTLDNGPLLEALGLGEQLAQPEQVSLVCQGAPVLPVVMARHRAVMCARHLAYTVFLVNIDGYVGFACLLGCVLREHQAPHLHKGECLDFKAGRHLVTHKVTCNTLSCVQWAWSLFHSTCQ